MTRGGADQPDTSECTGTPYYVNPDDPSEGVDIHHDGPCEQHPDTSDEPTNVVCDNCGQPNPSLTTSAGRFCDPACADAYTFGVSEENEPMTINDCQAREIAAAWHGGQWSPLYALASTGAIIGESVEHDWLDTTTEIREAMDEAQEHLDEAYRHDLSLVETYRREVDELAKLLAYVEAHGVRGPQEGWVDR